MGAPDGDRWRQGGIGGRGPGVRVVDVVGGQSEFRWLADKGIRWQRRAERQTEIPLREPSVLEAGGEELGCVRDLRLLIRARVDLRTVGRCPYLYCRVRATLLAMWLLQPADLHTLCRATVFAGRNRCLDEKVLAPAPPRA